MYPYVDAWKLRLGDSLPPLEKDPVTKTQLVRYAGASGDFNPLHTDDTVARKAGLQGVIAQGPLIMGFVGQAITQWFPKRYLRRFVVRFKGMTVPGDRIVVGAIVKEKRKTKKGALVVCEATAMNQHGEVKLTGQFEILVPVSEKGESI